MVHKFFFYSIILLGDKKRKIHLVRGLAGEDDFAGHARTHTHTGAAFATTGGWERKTERSIFVGRRVTRPPLVFSKFILY